MVFELLDRETRSFITLNSRNYQAKISNELLENLQDIPGYLGYSINKSQMDLYIYHNVEEKLIEKLEKLRVNILFRLNNLSIFESLK